MSDARKRVLVVHPHLAPLGGGEAIAALILRALRRDYEVEIACLLPPDFAGLNRSFGTDLQGADFKVHLLPAWLVRRERLPGPRVLLRLSLLERFVKCLALRRHYDLCFSTRGGLSLPQPGIQYLHFPDRPRPNAGGGPSRFGHAAYELFCRILAGRSEAAVWHNLTLVNSEFTAARLRQNNQSVRPRVVHPPALGHFAPVAWSVRKNRFVCCGRIGGQKETAKVVEIVRELRRRGHDVDLALIGTPDPDDGGNEIMSSVAPIDWISCAPAASRTQICSLLAQSRYGIHGMAGEPFGMAVAEMQEAGSIVFAPAFGGAAEIVGQETRLLYRSAEEAITKIEAVLSDPNLQAALHARSLARRGRFAEERFAEQIRAVVDEELRRPGRRR